MEDYTQHVTVIREGISFGTALAIAISFSKNRSIFWAIIAGLLSWFYVIYIAFRGGYSK